MKILPYMRFTNGGACINAQIHVLGDIAHVGMTTVKQQETRHLFQQQVRVGCRVGRE